MRVLAILMIAVSLVVPAPELQKSSEPAQISGPDAQSLCEIGPEDYAVYSAILDNLGRPEDPEEEWRDKRDIVFVDRTVTGQSADGKAWGFRSASKQAPKPDTIKNFDSRVAGSCQLQTRFTSKISPTLISKELIEKNFKKKGDGWERFYKEHPGASGYWDFSAVGYSENGEEALVYLGHHCGYLCGTGHLVLLAKENGGWVVKNRVMLWIS